MGDYAAAFDPALLGADLLERVGRAVVDTCAVGLAGQGEPASQRGWRYARTAGGDGGGALAARCWGRAQTLPLEFAALYNGIAAHVLDYDDVTSPLRGHPSVAMLPALVALGETLDASGRELAGAYVVGFEVICRLARAIGLRHYAKGWHSTATIGGLGCAVACARLLGLDAVRTSHAIGLAVAQAAGARANFGTHAKAFQAGHANALGLRAALLAREGFDAAPDILEAGFGYAALYGHGESLVQAMAGLGTGPSALEHDGIEVKKYPLCYATHRTLDGVLDLRAAWGLELAQVKSVQVRTSANALTPLIHPRPRTCLEGKFSMQYAVAAALADGRVGLSSFTDAAVQRAELQRFFPAVTTSEASGELLPRWAEIDIVLHDGRQLRQRVDGLRGSAQQPLTAAELRAKFHDCVAFGAVDIDADAFCDHAMHLGDTRVRTLAAALCPSS
ncbi:MmgE/PrpD family protein [Xylophilus sp. Kf1]|nr:MmgE/PrpD family protein [Xylophilus sp. Kf1]